MENNETIEEILEEDSIAEDNEWEASEYTKEQIGFDFGEPLSSEDEEIVRNIVKEVIGE